MPQGGRDRGARLGRETDWETRKFLVDVRVKQVPKNWTVGQGAGAHVETGRKESTLAFGLLHGQTAEAKTDRRGG